MKRKKEKKYNCFYYCRVATKEQLEQSKDKEERTKPSKITKNY